MEKELKNELEELKSILQDAYDMKGAIWDVEDELKANQRNISDDLLKSLTEAVDAIRHIEPVLEKLNKILDKLEKEDDE